MIEIQIPLGYDIRYRTGRYMIEILDDPPTSIPYFKPDFMVSVFYIILDETLRNWFIDMKIDYSLKARAANDYYIIFEKESDAILFKLAWVSI